ncbi:hypothetical protein CDD83_2465 [Cordyceps sp. RAO-2017]|nr:hypothetical protein CDD83_2465 [Cordyceps sp. RAO-2017]
MYCICWLLVENDTHKLNLSAVEQLAKRPLGSKLKLGLFAYPVLQAADILVHRATHVPVGHDQQQHLEFARQCVTNFNHSYGPHLVYPETITPSIHRIKSLTHPTLKMSKSHHSERSRILITDTPDDIHTKIASALTDSLPGISYDVDLAAQYSEAQPRQLKILVSDAIIQGLRGIRERYLELINSEPGYLDHVEAQGALKARRSAQETMELVRNAVGL